MILSLTPRIHQQIQINIQAIKQFLDSYKPQEMHYQVEREERNRSHQHLSSISKQANEASQPASENKDDEQMHFEKPPQSDGVSLHNEHSKLKQRHRKQTLIFACFLLVIQVFMCIAHGLVIDVVFTALNIGSILKAILLSILVLIGFGLLCSFLKGLAWSSLGFNFFIVALCLEFYPLINALWAKIGLPLTAVPTSYFAPNSYPFYLSNTEDSLITGNTITNCFKCSLSIFVAFSSVMGRTGPPEILILTIFGVIGFELNRLVIQRVGNDTFGTFTIFTYGGFMGLTLGLISTIRERRNHIRTKLIKSYRASMYSVTLSMFGALFIFALFPILSTDISSFFSTNRFNSRTNPLNLVLAMASAFISSFLVSTSLYGDRHVNVRDLINGSVAGAIACGSSAFFITNPVYAIVCGFFAGFIQSLFQNFIEKWLLQKVGIISTFSISLFPVQGLLGGISASVFKAIVKNNSNNLSYSEASLEHEAGNEMLVCLVSAGIGIGVGIIIGSITACINKMSQHELFTDKTFWMNSDGIKLVDSNKDIISSSKQHTLKIQPLNLIKKPKDSIQYPPELPPQPSERTQHDPETDSQEELEFSIANYLEQFQ